jgi:hypothetical protein
MIAPPALRKALLALHIVSSIGLIGTVASFLVLAVSGIVAIDIATVEAAYLSMSMLTWRIIVPMAFVALAVGVIQSLLTPWGLFRHYWVVAKLVLTVFAVVVLMVQTATIERLADAAASGSLVGLAMGQVAMVVHAAGGLAVLVVATLLSVYKPRGMTPLARLAASRG